MKSVGWLIALACIGAPQMAQSRQDIRQGIRLDTQMFVERVSTDINGRARRILQSADRAGSGDQLILVVNWRNEGSRPVRNLAVTNAVPRGAQLDLSNPAMQVSVDGGAHWGRLTDFWLPTALGGTRRAIPADITHVRWTVPDEITPGESGRLSYRATVR
ncbi:MULTISPECIES: hypothetical protein [unclassified Sphingobium]|uniref:hypothetical protein n=1 Tax=unclassified Sphingobium TaxID=2611147 RepID=UPI00076FFD2A|nr:MULTISPECIES: hypothetical protein [unclassified Sphingobium]AMK22514.1 hypothetical protein K426_07835 [Sphingobium sp. TKS]NML89936.1 hypothetical protein [Sphingobium sp. TB-6]